MIGDQAPSSLVPFIDLAETWDGLTYCPATREAVEEREEQGEIGCPACGRPASDHLREATTLALVGWPFRGKP